MKNKRKGILFAVTAIVVILYFGFIRKVGFKGDTEGQGEKN